MAAENVKQTSEIHTVDNEGFVSDQYKDPDIEAATIQKKGKQKKKKNKSKFDILEN